MEYDRLFLQRNTSGCHLQERWSRESAGLGMSQETIFNHNPLFLLPPPFSDNCLLLMELSDTCPRIPQDLVPAAGFTRCSIKIATFLPSRIKIKEIRAPSGSWCLLEFLLPPNPPLLKAEDSRDIPFEYSPLRVFPKNPPPYFDSS